MTLACVDTHSSLELAGIHTSYVHIHTYYMHTCLHAHTHTHTHTHTCKADGGGDDVAACALLLGLAREE